MTDWKALAEEWMDTMTKTTLDNMKTMSEDQRKMLTPFLEVAEKTLTAFLEDK